MALSCIYIPYISLFCLLCRNTARIITLLTLCSFRKEQLYLVFWCARLRLHDFFDNRNTTFSSSSYACHPRQRHRLLLDLV